MKKILIVNDNLHMGGIQKSLINFLKENYKRYEITLLLLFNGGELLSEVPDEIKILSASKFLNVLGAYKSDLKKNAIHFFWKGFLIVLAKIFSKKFAFRFSAFAQKKIRGFDVAISFSHPSKKHDLRSCSAEFVLNKVDTKEKICFVHADYKNIANQCEYTNKIYCLFDKIACCSDSVKKNFLDILPKLKEKVYTVRNFYDLSLIEKLEMNNYLYDQNYINIVSVARLSLEKGIDRAVQAIYESGRKDIRYYIVGDGPMRTVIEKLILDNTMLDRVFLIGETINPYIYMKNADYLLVPSFHEAAPMVFDEAKLLGLRIITTNTTSAVEMVAKEGGIVCDNSKEGIKGVLLTLEKGTFVEVKIYNNDNQRKQFFDMIYC